MRRLAMTVAAAIMCAVFVIPSGYGEEAEIDGSQSEWIALGGLHAQPITALALSDDNTLYAVAKEERLYRSDDMGATWTLLTLPQRHVTINAVTCLRNDVLVGTIGHGVLLSEDRGMGWLSTTRAIQFAENGICFKMADGILYVGRDRGILRTTDGGRTWSSKTVWFDRRTGSGADIRSLDVDGRDVWAGARAYGGVWHSSDGGNSWEPAGFKGEFIYSIGVAGDAAFAITGVGLHRSDDSGRSWVLEDLARVALLTKVQDKLHAVTVWGRLYLWEPVNRSWRVVQDPIPDTYGDVQTVAVKTDVLYAGTSFGRILTAQVSGQASGTATVSPVEFRATTWPSMKENQ